MTTLFLAGAENPTHQQILYSCGVSHMAVNVSSLIRRKTGSWELNPPYEDWEWVAYTDGPVSLSDLTEIVDRSGKPPMWVIGPEEWLDFADGSSGLVLWNGEGSIPDTRDNGLAITDRVFKNKELRRRALGTRSLGTVLGAITGSTDIAISKFDIVISGSWWSSMKFGETQVWDGRKMSRYNAERKHEVRDRHRDDIQALGMDLDQVLLGDPDEVCRLAVVSWQHYGDSLNRANVLPFKNGQVTTQEESLDEFLGSEPKVVDTHPSQGRHKKLLPVLGMTSITSTERLGDGSEVVEEQPIVTSVSDSIRSCDNCYLATSGCPGFQAGATCTFSIPIEIRSKDQLQAVLQSMVEIQTQRVLMARFAEEIAGQELSPEVGKEMDRLFASVEKMRDIMDNRESVRMTVEARGRSGVLSRLFGDRVGANARMLGTPVESEDVMDAMLDDGDD